jgi:Domain of unknown function (DUF4340)
MKIRGSSIWQWWCVLALSLGAAYWASRPPVGEQSESKIAIVSIETSRIAQVELTSTDSFIVASRRPELADRFWIDVKRTPPVAAAGGVKAASNSERFMSSKKLMEALATLAPFQATRVIGKVNADQLADFGLADSKKTLLVKDAGGEALLSLRIGKQMYGSRNLYVLNEADQTVLLISSDFTADFEKSEIRYFERAFMAIEPEDVQAGTITFGGKTAKLTRVKRDAKGALIWTAFEGDGAVIAAATPWFERFYQLKAASYAGVDEQARLMSVPPVAEVMIVAGGSKSEAIQLRKVKNVDQDEYWMTSGYLGWNVKIAAAKGEALSKDIPQLMNP